MDLSGKSVLVFGAGVSGFSAAKTLLEQQAMVTLADGKERGDLKHAEGLAELVVRLNWRWGGRMRHCWLAKIC